MRELKHGRDALGHEVFPHAWNQSLSFLRRLSNPARRRVEPGVLISLHANDWQLQGYWPWVPIRNSSAETGFQLMALTDWLPATVPGGVHWDLHRAGLIAHPHRDLQSTACEWVQSRWWVYKTTIERPAQPGCKIELVFQGLDYEAGIYVADTHLGDHEGMFEPAVFDVTALFAEHERVELKVVLRHAPDEMGQIGKTSQTFTQKARFGYKWDFSTRLVNIGIWDDVHLRVSGDWSLGDVALHTDVLEGRGIIEWAAAVVPAAAAGKSDAPMLLVEVRDPDGALVHAGRLAENSGRIELAEPQLWWPNGHGAQPLYAVAFILLDGDTELDRREYRTGLRKLGYARNEGSPPEALPYTFVINDKQIHIQGVNLTPLDLLYGNVTPAHYEWVVWSMRQAHVNMVRVWGGGIIEKEVFYDLCDRHGILVWQEFIQSSSGVDNIPSQRPEFLALLEKSALAALKTRRNHVSLAVWSGGNELRGDDRPSTLEDPNLAMLARLVAEHDPRRLFLPTSATGPVEFMTTRKGVMHDVHGWWKYLGNPRHYELYGESDSLFHSEFGVDGMSRVKSLRKFLGEPHLRPARMTEDFVWRHHGEWWDTLGRDEEFFGPLAELAVFADCSQWMQAEGLRFILEANRRRKFRNSGSIVWQLNEPWPNVSCTNLQDYYGEAKMALHWARQAFAPLHLSLDYRRLDWAPGTQFAAEVWAHQHGASQPLAATARCLDGRGAVLHEQTFETELAANRATRLGRFEFEISPAHGELFFVRLTTGAHENLYVFGTSALEPYAPALRLPPARLEIVAQGRWEERNDRGCPLLTRAYELTNAGEAVALHIRAEETTDAWWMNCEGDFTTLFPGEKRTVTVRCARREAGGFLSRGPAAPPPEPEISFRAFAGPLPGA